jgi:plastocyanin
MKGRPVRLRVRSVSLAAAVALALCVPAAAHAATKVVQMGEPSNVIKTFETKYSSDVNDFFPHGVTVHVGDSVNFVDNGFHVLDLPKKGGKSQPLVMPTGQTVTGATDAAGSPFWFNGQAQVSFNLALLPSHFGKKVTYTGKSEVLSGFPPNKPKPFTVKFSKTGSFTYYCPVHPGMKGVVKVVAKSRKIPSLKQDKAAVKTQVARDLKTAKELGSTKVPAGTVDVGSAGPHGVEYYGFFPKALTVPVGTTLNFRMTQGSFETHTASTGPGDPSTPGGYLATISAAFQGTTPTIDPRAAYASDPAGAPAKLTPTYHGNGFWHSGPLDTSNATPFPSSNSVTFSAAGTYQFFCLIHPFMHATVVVK